MAVVQDPTVRPGEQVNPDDSAVAARIFGLLAARRPGATVCPSEVARALAPADGAWRARMPQVRQVAQQLAQSGRLVVTRRGAPVDALRAGGPIRLGLPVGGGGNG